MLEEGILQADKRLKNLTYRVIWAVYVVFEKLGICKNHLVSPSKLGVVKGSVRFLKPSLGSEVCTMHPGQTDADGHRD